MAVSAAQVRDTVGRITAYVSPYKEILFRHEQGTNLEIMLLGLTSDLERKSVEPIAVRHGVAPRVLQGFVGVSRWDHRPLREQELREVSAEIGCADADLIIDGSAVAKKGKATVGTRRQYCGRLGKVDNCVIGVHAVYVGKDEQSVLVESQLYLPEEWLADAENRQRTHVPLETTYLNQTQIALSEINMLAQHLPFGWVHADEEFGRCQIIRDGVRALGKWYCFDVPRHTMIVRTRQGNSLRTVEKRVDQWVDSLPDSEWRRLKARDGEKGPMEYRVTSQVVFTNRPDGVACRERLLVLEGLTGGDRRYFLCHAPESLSLAALAARALRRHHVEEVFEECKGEVGMAHFEVRSWHGWHHHMSLVAIAHWFLVREKRRLGKRGSPGMTVSIIRTLVGKLLAPIPTPELLADFANYQMERNEASRRAAYEAQGLVAPPRRWEVPNAPL